MGGGKLIIVVIVAVVDRVVLWSSSLSSMGADTAERTVEVADKHTVLPILAC